MQVILDRIQRRSVLYELSLCPLRIWLHKVRSQVCLTVIFIWFVRVPSTHQQPLTYAIYKYACMMHIYVACMCICIYMYVCIHAHVQTLIGWMCLASYCLLRDCQCSWCEVLGQCLRVCICHHTFPPWWVTERTDGISENKNRIKNFYFLLLIATRQHAGCLHPARNSSGLTMLRNAPCGTSAERTNVLISNYWG
jgi:hypothetical protein